MRAARDGAVLAGLLFLAYLFLVIAPAQRTVGFDAFAYWNALLVANLVWLSGRSVRVLWLLALPPVAFELYHGNVHLWIASAIVLGFRYPWTWPSCC